MKTAGFNRLAVHYRRALAGDSLKGLTWDRIRVPIRSIPDKSEISEGLPPAALLLKPKLTPCTHPLAHIGSELCGPQECA